MPFSVVVGGVVRHVMYCTVPGQVSSNKRDWQCLNISGGTTVNSTDILGTIDTAFAAALKSVLSQDAMYYGSQLYYQTPTPPRPRPDSTVTNQGAGDVTSELLPQQTAGIISLYSDDLGPSGQGRIYLPFPGVFDNGLNATPIPDYISRLTAIGGLLTSTFNVVSGTATATFAPVLYVPGGAPPKRITRFLARDAWATQRRRGNFGRLNANPF